MDSQNFDVSVPVYESVPDGWEDARGLLTENMKRISNGVNNKASCWYLATEIDSGKKFIPSTSTSGNTQQYRTIFRKVVDFGAVSIGLNAPVSHGITFDSNFSIINLYAGATNATTFIAVAFPNNNDSISLTSTDILINSTSAYDRCYVVIEYIKEI